MDTQNMKVIQLKSILKSRGASTVGKKDQLIKRVNELMQTEETKVERNDDKACNDTSTPEPQPDISINEESTEESVSDSNNSFLEIAFPEKSESNALKRKHEEIDVSSPKKVKNQTLPKNPIVILNEFFPGLAEYVDLSDNSQANDWFVVEVNFKGEKFQGGAFSKREAKQKAAAAALGSVVQFMYPDKVYPYVTKIDRSKLDFTSDSLEGVNLVPTYIHHEEFGFQSPPKDQKKLKVSSPKSPKLDPNKHPVSMLTELHPGIPFECLQKGPPVFTMQVEINGNAYQGYGKSKKSAKVGAAIRALRGEYNLVMSAPDQEVVPSNNEDDSFIQISGDLPDLAHNLIQEKFDELTASNLDLRKHKVLAGIVMTKGEDTDGEVVSLATGTKCINGEHISKQGTVLFDCHAEIVSRRGLRKFFFEQLITLSKGGQSIFESHPNGGYCLKKEISFHLYINTSPCGDARIFSPHESSAETDDNHPNRRSRGLLRTKIENGEGTIPVDKGALIQERGKGNVQQMWDAIIGGERLLTMSCSDKIAKWNVLGVQGSLLSSYIEPVYLSSIILGSLYHCKHLERAVFSRVNEAVQALSETTTLNPAYKVNRPLLAAVPNPPKRVAKKAQSFCLHWTRGEDEAQVISTFSGRTPEKSTSTLCKAEMMRLMKELMAIEDLNPRVQFISNRTMTYSQMKNMATDYQEAKHMLMTGLHKVECGSWVGKPSEVDDFILD